MTEQEMRDMPLHSTQRIEQYLSVRRVPGGWLYAEENYSDQAQIVFVPDLQVLGRTISDAIYGAVSATFVEKVAESVFHGHPLEVNPH